MVLAGVFDEVSVFIRSALVQFQTPEHMKGRVSNPGEHDFYYLQQRTGRLRERTGGAGNGHSTFCRFRRTHDLGSGGYHLVAGAKTARI